MSIRTRSILFRTLIMLAVILSSLGPLVHHAEAATPTGFTCTALGSQASTVSTPTAEKPESKVWSYDGKWWSVFPASAGVSSSGAWLWRLDLVSTTWTWIPQIRLSTSTTAKADAKPAGSLVHILLYNGSSTELASVQYNSAAHTYETWSSRGTLTSVSLSGSETATIDIDSTGRMWLATEEDSTSRVVVYYSASPYTAFTGPVEIATGVNNDDISVVTALPNNTVGVLWSNQNTKRFGFKYHKDADPVGTWSVDEVPASQSALNIGAGMADDHLNVAVASNGTLYAAVKTSYDNTSYPKMAMLVRRLSGSSGAGVWDDLYDVSRSGTRPIVLLDESWGVVTVIYSSAEGGGSILYQQASIDQPIVFESAQTMRSPTNNDASSTKQNINGEMVTIYSNGTTINGSLCTSAPTAVTLNSFTAMVEKKSVLSDGKSVILSWETTSEVNNLGFNLYRATSIDGERKKVNAELIPTLVNPGSLFGAIYSYMDAGIKNNKTYYYWLEDVDISGKTTGLTGPESVKIVAGKIK
jgi:large repetitive protein